MKLTIKNFGPLDDAMIQIGDFTVLAGPNNTGKSFVSKFLYSLFDAMNANHASVAFEAMMEPLERWLQILEKIGYESEEPLFSVLRDDIQKVKHILREAFPTDFPQIESEIEKIKVLQPRLTEAIAQIVDNYPLLKEKVKKREDRFSSMAIDKDNIEPLDLLIHKLEERFRDNEFVINFGLFVKFNQNIQDNFQVSDLSYLKREKSSPLNFHIEGIGELENKDGEGFFHPHPGGIQKLQQHSRVIYLESPIYWKLKEALENLRLNPRFSRNREQMDGVPGYFYGLVSTFRMSYPYNDTFQDLHKWLVQAIGGKLVISDNNELLFQEDDKSFSLSLVATGVTNLGFLSLLIEKNILDRGTFLFIDEPEAHLHPAWQVIMAELLFELARQGVKVVIATHSVDIIKWLEVRLKKNPKDEELVALNQFPVSNSTDNEDCKTKMAKISEELTKPFSDLYIKGI